MDGNHKTTVFRAAPYIITQHQAGAIKTVMGKAHFEQWLWDQWVSKVKYYHGENGFSLPRTTVAIVKRKDKVILSQGLALYTKMHVLRELSNQSQTWSHPISMEMREYSWLPTLLQPLRELIEGLVGTHSVWIYNYNCVPNARSGLTPLELVTKERSDYKDILCCHVWGCPVYVL